MASGDAGSPPISLAPALLIDNLSISSPTPPLLNVTGEDRDVTHCCAASVLDPPMNPVGLQENTDRLTPQPWFIPPTVYDNADHPTAIDINATTPEDPPSITQKLPPYTFSADNTHSSVGGGRLDGTMVFGHKTMSGATQRRRNYANTNAVTDYEADLTNKDRTKQKEAVRRYLGEKIKQNWTYEWPRPDTATSADDSFTFKPSNDQIWKQRDEWHSDASVSTENLAIPTTATSPDTPSMKDSTLRFENHNGVEESIKKLQDEKKRKRKKRLAEEVAFNDGLRCFVARRDAWTGARRVSKSNNASCSLSKPAQRASVSSGDGGSSTAIEVDDDEEWETDSEIPIAPPLIPSGNAMRASILPTAYNVIYDKVVVQSVTPACPLNLKDIVGSCVQGWKRDGQWPPISMPEPAQKKSRKLSVASLFNWKETEKEVKSQNLLLTTEGLSGKDSEKKPSVAGFRKSFQKILTLGHASKESSRETTAVP